MMPFSLSALSRIADSSSPLYVGFTCLLPDTRRPLTGLSSAGTPVARRAGTGGSRAARTGTAEAASDRWRARGFNTLAAEPCLSRHRNQMRLSAGCDTDRTHPESARRRLKQRRGGRRAEAGLVRSERAVFACPEPPHPGDDSALCGPWNCLAPTRPRANGGRGRLPARLGNVSSPQSGHSPDLRRRPRRYRRQRPGSQGGQTTTLWPPGLRDPLASPAEGTSVDSGASGHRTQTPSQSTTEAPQVPRSASSWKRTFPSRAEDTLRTAVVAGKQDRQMEKNKAHSDQGGKLFPSQGSPSSTPNIQFNSSCEVKIRIFS